MSSKSELEVNERTAIRAHELVNHEDDERCCRHHGWERERCKRDAVAGFHALWNPVDKHARDEHENDVDVFPSDGEDGIPTPGRSHLVHHVLSRVPCDFVCFCRVEVRTSAEEETRERDEHKRERHIPGGREPRQCFSAEQMINNRRVNAHEKHAEPHSGNCAYWNCVMLVENRTQCKESKSDGCTDGRAALDPELVEHLAKAVQAAPDNEVPASAMPPASHDLRCHGVHVRGYRLARIRFEVGHNANVEEEHAKCDADPHAARKEDGYKAQETHPEERADGCVPVTAKGDVQVVAPPARKRNMPTAPEFGRALCLVRTVEVLWQAEAHQKRNANSDVGVTREVRIDL